MTSQAHTIHCDIAMVLLYSGEQPLTYDEGVPMLSVSESAALLHVTPARVRALISEGTLPATKVGRAWILQEQDVLQRIANRPSPGRPKHVSKKGTLVANEGDRANTKADLHALFLNSKEAFCVRPDAATLIQAESDEEASFYLAVADFFLQQRQRELIAQGVS